MDKEKITKLNDALKRNHDAIFDAIQNMTLNGGVLPVFGVDFPEPEARDILLEAGSELWSTLAAKLEYDEEGRVKRIEEFFSFE